MTTDVATPTIAKISLSERAAKKIRELLEKEGVSPEKGGLRVGVRDARHRLVVRRVALSGDVRGHNVSLVLADVCQGPDPVDIANGPDLFASPQILVHVYPVWVRLDADGLEPDPFDARMTAGRHQQYLGL